MRRALLLTSLVCLLAPATGVASGRDVIRDCTDNGKVDGYHSPGDYKGALGDLPSDVDEYTDCRTIINTAKRRDAKGPPDDGGGGGSGSGGGGGFGGFGSGFDAGAYDDLASTPPTGAEQGALDAAATAAPVTVQGDPIVPGAAGLGSKALRNSVPAPLLVMLVLIGIGALALSITRLRARGAGAPPPVLRVVNRVFPRTG